MKFGDTIKMRAGASLVPKEGATATTLVGNSGVIEIVLAQPLGAMAVNAAMAAAVAVTLLM
jgi:hypothetical protein